jgi:hypothetical protein
MCGSPSVAIDQIYVGVQMVFEILHGIIFDDCSSQIIFDGAQCERELCDGPGFWNIDLL